MVAVTRADALISSKARSALQSFPTLIISRLIDVLIEELDRRSGDCDFEAKFDACAAGDDAITCVPPNTWLGSHRQRWLIGDDDDAEL